MCVHVSVCERLPHIFCQSPGGWAHTPPALQPTFYTPPWKKNGPKCPEPKSNLFLVTPLSFSLCASSENCSATSLNVLCCLSPCTNVDCEYINYC